MDLGNLVCRVLYRLSVGRKLEEKRDEIRTNFGRAGGICAACFCRRVDYRARVEDHRKSSSLVRLVAVRAQGHAVDDSNESLPPCNIA